MYVSTSVRVLLIFLSYTERKARPDSPVWRESIPDFPPEGSSEVDTLSGEGLSWGREFEGVGQLGRHVSMLQAAPSWASFSVSCGVASS